MAESAKSGVQKTQLIREMSMFSNLSHSVSPMKFIRLSVLSSAMIMGASFTTSMHAADVKEVFQTVQQNGKDLKANANLVMAEGSNLADGVVLLTHGTLTHKERSTYKHLQQNLANAGVNSLAINLTLGLDNRHGEYDCAVPHKHKHTDALQEMGVWLDWLKSQGAENITLVGHSRGGNQTAWFADQAAYEGFERVVLVAPAFNGPSEVEYNAKSKVKLAKYLSVADQLQKEGKAQSLIKGMNFIYCTDAQASAEAVLDYYQDQAGYHTIELLKEAKKPVLVAIGSEDNVVEGLQDALDSVNNELVSAVVVEDADHFFLDFANEDLATAISEFIAN